MCPAVARPEQDVLDRPENGDPVLGAAASADPVADSKDLVLTALGKREVLLSSGEDGAVRLRDPCDPPAVQRPTRFAGAITGPSVAHLPDGPVGTKAVVLAGDTAGNAQQ